MISAELKEYIQNARANGTADDKITEELRKAGWSSAVIREALGFSVTTQDHTSGTPYQKLFSKKVVIAILGIILSVAGAFFIIWLPSTRSTEKELAPLMELSTDLARSVTSQGNVNSTDSQSTFHYAFVSIDAGNPLHVIYDGKDMGVFGGAETPFLILNDGNIAFSRRTNSSNNIDYRQQFIYDGKELGEMVIDITRTPIEYLYALPFISKNHFAYVGVSGDLLDFEGVESGRPYQTYIVYDGKNLGAGFNPIVAGDHLLYEKVVGGDVHYIYDGNDVGKKSPHEILPWYHGETIQEVNGEKHIFYKGKDWGNFDNGTYTIQDGHIAIVREASQFVSGGTTQHSFNVFYDGKDLGQAMNTLQEKPVLSRNHIAFIRYIDNQPHVIFDSKDLGVGHSIQLEGEHSAFINGQNHIIIDGKDMGLGSYPVIDLE